MKLVARRFAFALVLGITLAFNAGHVFAFQSASISEEEYWALVEDSRETVLSLRGEAPEAIKSALKTLSQKWESVTAVTRGDGQVVALDNSYLLAALNAEEPDPNDIVEIFDALLSAHRNYPSEVFSPNDLAPLNKILARPEFQWNEGEDKNPVNDFFQKLINKFLEWLNKLFGGGDNETVVVDAPVSPLPFAATVLLLLVLLYAFRTLFGDFIREARALDENGGEETLTSKGAFERAQALSRGGDYRSAVRYLYLSSLLLLDERGLLRYDRSKTNREYLRSVSSSPEIAKPLGEVIEIFDDVWYGYHPMDENSFQTYSARVNELKEKKP
jgi:hypothetical protein